MGSSGNARLDGNSKPAIEVFIDRAGALSSQNATLEVVLQFAHPGERHLARTFHQLAFVLALAVLAAEVDGDAIALFCALF